MRDRQIEKSKIIFRMAMLKDIEDDGVKAMLETKLREKKSKVGTDKLKQNKQKKTVD